MNFSNLSNVDKAKLLAKSQKLSSKLIGPANTLKLDKKLAAGAHHAYSQWNDVLANFTDSTAKQLGYSRSSSKVKYLILGVVAGVVIVKVAHAYKSSRKENSSNDAHKVTETVRDGLHKARETVSEASQDLGNSIQEISHRHSSAVKDAIGHEDKVNAVSEFNETVAEKAKNLADKADEKSEDIIEKGSEKAHDEIKKDKKHKHNH